MKSSLRTGLFLVLLAVVMQAEAGDLLVEHVSPLELAQPDSLTNTSAFASVSRPFAPPISVRPTNDLGERWQKFEAEFGITQRERTLLKGSLQLAKYEIDRTTFLMHEAIDGFAEYFRFDYKLSDLALMPRELKSTRATTGNLITDTINNAHLKSEVNLGLSEKAFVGVKLVLPVGD